MGYMTCRLLNGTPLRGRIPRLRHMEAQGFLLRLKNRTQHLRDELEGHCRHVCLIGSIASLRVIITLKVDSIPPIVECSQGVPPSVFVVHGWGRHVQGADRLWGTHSWQLQGRAPLCQIAEAATPSTAQPEVTPHGLLITFTGSR